MVQMYHENFISNDTLYNFRHARLEEKQRKIHAHHIIQSFSPEDHLTPEQINQIGYETMKELTGGKFRFIVATHADKITSIITSLSTRLIVIRTKKTQVGL